MTIQQAAMQAAAPRVSLIAKLAARFEVEPEKMLSTLKATAFRAMQDGKPLEVSNEQMMALMIVADQYKLNPFTKELFAFPDKSNGIVPVVSIDGWTRIVNDCPEFDGFDVKWSEETITSGDKKVPTWCEITMHRKDRTHPVVHREWFDECKRGTGPWGSHPRRMLEHKTYIQTARRAFGFGGIYDVDEAERIIDVTPEKAAMPDALLALNANVRPQAQPVDGRSVLFVLIQKLADFRAAVEEAATADDIHRIADQCARVDGMGELPEYQRFITFAQLKADNMKS
jgi:phage recombination protein Bet